MDGEFVGDAAVIGAIIGFLSAWFSGVGDAANTFDRDEADRRSSQVLGKAIGGLLMGAIVGGIVGYSLS